MENSIVNMIVTTLVVLLSGLSGFLIPFVGGISALMNGMPDATLTVASSISAVNFALAQGCCVCIPIPLALGAFVLFRRANAPALEGSLAQRGADR